MVNCNYCGKSAELVTGETIYPHRPDLYSKNFYLCRPCDAYVGCHRTGTGDKPLGRLANAELRAWKSRAHAAFDPYWKNGGGMGRKTAYKRLAYRLGIKTDDCHIGMFDVETCQKVVEICEKGL